VKCEIWPTNYVTCELVTPPPHLPPRKGPWAYTGFLKGGGARPTRVIIIYTKNGGGRGKSGFLSFIKENYQKGGGGAQTVRPPT